MVIVNGWDVRLLFNLVVLVGVPVNYIFLTLQQQRQQQQQHQQEQREHETYRQHGARSLAVCAVVLSYELGIEVAIRINFGLGIVIPLLFLHIVCLIISKLRSCRVVDDESASQLILLVERLNVWTILVSPRPMGMSHLQAVVRAVACCLRVLGWATGMNREGDELEDRMIP